MHYWYWKFGGVMSVFSDERKQLDYYKSYFKHPNLIPRVKKFLNHLLIICEPGYLDKNL